MIIKQLSVFLENKTGRLSEVASILGKAGVNMTAYSVADNSDFGILRVIVSDIEKAQEVLKKEQFATTVTDVLCLRVPNTPGALAKALNILVLENISIDYMYAFSQGTTANVIIKVHDLPTCIEVLNKHQLELVAANELYKF
jgi:hypothetical protein